MYIGQPCIRRQPLACIHRLQAICMIELNCEEFALAKLEFVGPIKHYSGGANVKRDMQTFLLQRFGQKSKKLLSEQASLFKECVINIRNKSDSQRKTMTKTILPRVALYKALQKNGFPEAEAKEIVKDYMHFQLTPMVKTLKWVDRYLPFSFALLQKIGSGSSKNDSWRIENLQRGKNRFSFDVIDCLWYNTCMENDCSELCSTFCDNDIYLYGDLVNTAFNRTQTIASGGKVCDFVYEKT